MNRIEDYYNCVRNSRLEWYLYRPEYLHLVAVVETVMILPTSSTIGSSYHFRNWIASHPSLHPSPRLQSRNEPISTTYRRLFILNQKVVFLLEAGIRDCNNGVFRVPDFVSCNDHELFHFSYQRYLENRIRETFGLEGTPVRMVIRERGEKD